MTWGGVALLPAAPVVILLFAVTPGELRCTSEDIRGEERSSPQRLGPLHTLWRRVPHAGLASHLSTVREWLCCPALLLFRIGPLPWKPHYFDGIALGPLG